MIFSPQIHIVFNAKETHRITEPLLQNPPHKLYYFTACIQKTKQKDPNLQFYHDNTQILKNKIPTIQIIHKEIDYVDYIAVIQEISKIVKIEREESPNATIYINISTGSKITSIASIEASKIWGLEYYYVYSSTYDPYDEGPVHKGDIYIEKPLTFPTQRPEKEHIQTLKLIDEMIQRRYAKKQLSKQEIQDAPQFAYLKDLVQKLQSSGIIDLESKHKDIHKRKSALYMKVKDFLRPLSKTLEYIEISSDTRNKKVMLSEKGKKLIQIFHYLN
ncbi:MAG: hypothetical protein JW776_11960 [Candidatus Lokiarchaeota archaeon]|nr:hypothetical protein [Candidatus Lokiarchaeota archaeon]